MIRLSVPLPPSANNYWRAVRGRVLLSADARAYRETCRLVACVQYRGEPLRGRLSVRYDVYRDLRGDLANHEKQLSDALQGVLWVDDSQVWDMRMVRHLDRDEPRVEITVEEMA